MPFSLFNKNPLARFKEKDLYKMYTDKVSAKDYDGAAEIADEFLRRGSQDYNGYYYKALAVTETDKAAALPLFKKALETCDKSDGSLLNLYRQGYALCLLRNRMLEKSVEMYADVYDSASQYMDSFAFFLYLMAVRDLRWKLLEAGDERAARQLFMDIAHKYVYYTSEAEIDADDCVLIQNMFEEIQSQKNPAESDYQL